MNVATFPDVQMQSRRVIRRAQKYLAEENRKQTPQLTPIAPDAWPHGLAMHGAVVRAWRSQRFLVTGYEAPAPALIRLSIIRASLLDDGNWAEVNSWDDLQRVKAECGYANHDAIEVYPADRDVVNVANMRHLWILAEACPLTWRVGQALA